MKYEEKASVKMKEKDSIETFWKEFLQENPDNPIREVPESYYFCDNKEDADECAALVVRKIKKATATSLWWFEKNKQPLPQSGDQNIITDWNGTPRAIVETIKVKPTPYHQITEEFAATEGEGDRSLAYWKKVHQAYYEREMAPFEESFDENMIIICEYFKTIYSK